MCTWPVARQHVCVDVGLLFSGQQVRVADHVGEILWFHQWEADFIDDISETVPQHLRIDH